MSTDPNPNVYLDVNTAFGSVLCDFIHGALSCEIAVTIDAKKDAVMDMVSAIFGMPRREETGRKVPLISEGPSRNGPVRKYDFPRIYTYVDPTSRVLQSRIRRCNPFFHLYEAMWFLAGRNDVASVSQFTKQISQYSDNGTDFNGAYGYRWRSHFGGDQLKTIIDTLKNDPNSRRCVLQMWDCRSDLQGFDRNPNREYHPADPNDLAYEKYVPFSRDVPCNTHAYVQMRNGELDLTVMNRSNDIFWGMLGSNYVTFTFLLEYLAGMIGVPVGYYHHFTANAHYYTDIFPDDKLEAMHDELIDQVWVPKSARVPLVCTPENFNRELQIFVDDPYTSAGFTERFFREVARPMMHTHRLYKEGDLVEAVEYAKEEIQQEDWKVNAINWIAGSTKAKSMTAFMSN
jgi:thymidylate synthase